MYYSILDIVDNKDGHYEGNLRHYFNLVFNAPNAEHPYHNFRHMTHIMFQIYDAVKFYNMEKRQARAALITGLAHDYGHKGIMGNDHENIAAAKKFITENILPEDTDLLPGILNGIGATEFPHDTSCVLDQLALIIRDADMSQLFSDSWVQQIVFGLAREFQMTPVAFLEQQIKFIPTIAFNTDWAKEKFEHKKESRLNEIKQFLEIVKN